MTVEHVLIADKEIRDGCECIVSVSGPQTTITNPSAKEREAAFTYDYSYFKDATSVSICLMSILKCGVYIISLYLQL